MPKIIAANEYTLTDLSDSYAVILSNEAHVFDGDQNGISGTQTTETLIIAYRGRDQVNCYVDGTISCPAGITVTNNQLVPSPTLTITATSAVTQGGYIDIPISVGDGSITFTKRFSYSIGKKGQTGATGTAGRGIASIHNFYLASAKKTGVTTSDAGWSSTTIPLTTATLPFLWQYQRITYTVGDPETTPPVLVGMYTEDGKGITSILEYFLISSQKTGIAATDQAWSTDVPTMTAQKPYLWTRGEYTYSDGTKSKTNPHIIGMYGEKGVSVTSTTALFYLSTSNTQVTGGTWVTTRPNRTAGTYIWQKLVTGYSNGTTTETDPVCLTGDTGATGGTGASGRGITKIEYFYLATNVNSGVTTSTSGWVKGSAPSTTNTNKYLWQYTVVTYDKAPLTETIAPQIIGVHGSSGRDGKGITKVEEKYAVSSSSTTAPTTWSSSVPQMTTANKYLWNYEIITFSDGTKFEGVKKVIGVHGTDGTNGQDGAAGKGITKVENYYLASASSTGITNASSGFTTSVQAISASKKYLWNYEVITFTDNTSSKTQACIIGTFGVNGQDGKSITGVTNYYLATSATSGVTTSTTGWTTTFQAISASKRALWNYEVISYSSGNPTTTTPVMIGYYGLDGGTGAPGKGISKIEEFYLVSASSTGVTTSTSGWQSTPGATSTTNKYLWNYEKITYTDSSTKNSECRVIGTHGATGGTGAAGRSLVSSVQQFYLSTSNTTQSGGSWVTTCPTWQPGKFLWKKMVFTYSNPSGTSETVPECDSSWLAVDEIQIGSRNLLRNSKRTKTTSDYLVDRWDLTENWEPGKEYTISFEGGISSGGVGTIGWWRDSGSACIHWTPTYKTKGNRKYFTFICPTAYSASTPDRILSAYHTPSDGRTGSATITNAMLEKGNKPSDWSLAPEDIEAEIDTKVNAAKTEVKAEIKVERDRITSMVSSTTTNINNIQAALNATRSDLETQINNSHGIYVVVEQSHSATSTNMSAKVYMNNKQLTDPQVTALGALTWYAGNTKIGNGKTLTRTVSGRETIRCVLESGGGGLMPEFIKLVDGSLATKGRNLALNSSPNKVDSNDYQFLVIRLASLPEHGQDFTIQIWGKLSPEMTAFRAYCHEGNGNLVPGNFVKTDYGYICKGKWKSKYTDTNGLHEYDDPYLYVYQLYLDQLTSNTKTSIEKVMVTFGHDEYTYSPAPEDEEVN